MGGFNKNFTTQTFHPRVIVTKAANYTVTLSDEKIRVNGAYTQTLFPISDMQGTLTSSKVLAFENIHATADATVTAGSGNTIGGASSVTVKPGDTIVIYASEIDADWTIASPTPRISGENMLGGMFNIVAANTNGTTAVNVFGSAGAPYDLTITGCMVIAKDTTAGNITVKNAGSTVSTVAKGTTAGVVTGEDGALANTTVSKGDAVTVVSSSTGNAVSLVTFTAP